MNRLRAWVEKGTSVPGSMSETGSGWVELAVGPCGVVVVPFVAVMLRPGVGKCPGIEEQVEQRSLVLWAGCFSTWAPRQEDGEAAGCWIPKIAVPAAEAGSAEAVVPGMPVAAAGGGHIRSPCMKVQQVCWACIVVDGRQGLNPFGCCGNPQIHVLHCDRWTAASADLAWK